MPLSSISPEGQAWVNQWHANQRFLGKDLLDIRITAEDSGWKHNGNPDRDRETRSTLYSASLSNNGATGLKDIQIKYCLYREKIGGISADYYDLGATEVPAGQSVSERGKIRHGSFKVDSNDWMNSVVGARFRFYWTASDGTVLTRDGCCPEDLDGDKFPWKEPEFTKEALAARAKPDLDLTPKDLAESDIRALVEQYADAWEGHDYLAWRKLLEPLNYKNKNLSESVFHLYLITSVSIKRIEGCNVLVQMTHKKGHDQLGWLQFHPSGTLKYTPLLFKHPMVNALNPSHLLYSENSSWRSNAERNLREAGAPLFGFDAEGSPDDQRDALEKIFKWIEENGATHDASDPKLPIPQEQFEELMKKVRASVDQAPS